MVNRIVVLDTGYSNYFFEEKLLQSQGYVLDIFKGKKNDSAGKCDFSHNALGIFVRWTKIDEVFLKNCPKLKVIIRYGTGYDNVDIKAATDAGVKVANVSGYGNHSVSDHALSLMFASARGLFQGVDTIRTNFGKPPFERVFEFHRKTLGILGLGRIGSTLAKKATTLFNQVIAFDPYISDTRFLELGVKKTTFDDLLMQSDVLSVHCNLTDETRGMINSEAFLKMIKKPIIINTSRGAVIEMDALLDALDTGKVFGAGLDVFPTELPEEIPDKIIDHPNIIATGHYAWYSENSIAELQKRAAENMLALLQGKRIEDCLN